MNLRKLSVAGGVARARICQAIGFQVEIATHVHYGEINGARQLPADPMQGIQSRAPAQVFSCDLFDNHLGIRVDVKRGGVESQRALQGF